MTAYHVVAGTDVRIARSPSEARVLAEHLAQRWGSCFVLAPDGHVALEHQGCAPISFHALWSYDGGPLEELEDERWGNAWRTDWEQEVVRER